MRTDGLTTVHQLPVTVYQLLRLSLVVACAVQRKYVDEQPDDAGNVGALHQRRVLVAELGERQVSADTNS